MGRRLKCLSLPRLAALAMAGLVTWVSFGNRVSAQNAFVTIRVTNVDELVGPAPDTRLAADLARHFGDHEVAHASTGIAHVTDRLDSVVMLIKIKSPDKINSVQRFNNTIRVAPVKDFEAFVESIDYGRVSGLDATRRSLRIKIRPSEVSKKGLLAAARSSGRRPRGFEELVEPPSRSSSSSRRNEGEYAQGDRVRFELGDVWVTASVIESGLTFDRARVRLESSRGLVERITDRQLKRRLIRAQEVVWEVPEDRLEELPAGGAAAGAARVVQRTWTDNTGKHQIIAIYGGVSGDRVRLSKPNGKESLVPLARLSEADQAYVRSLKNGADNPFSELAGSGGGDSPAADDGVPKTLRPKFNNLRRVRGRDFSEWSFVPPAGELPAATSPASASVSFTKGVGTGSWGEQLERLVVAADGSAAIGVRKWERGSKETYMVQRLDLAGGVAEPEAELPTKTVVLDVEPESGLVLSRRDYSGHNKNTKLRVSRLAGGRLVPVSEWEPASEDLGFPRDVDEARFLSADRLLVRVSFGNWVVWDATTATALYEIPLKPGSSFPVTTDLLGRVMAIGATGGVSLIDVEHGKHVATLDHTLGRVSAVGVSEDLTRLAAWGKNGLNLWDLTTGRLLHTMAKPPKVYGKSLEIVGDFVLVGGRYLLDPSRGIVLWEYHLPGGGSGIDPGTVWFRAGRLWYGPESERKFPLYVGSIAWPHAPVQELVSDLPAGDVMLAAKRGDTARVTLDTDRSPEERRQLLTAVEANLTKAGYRVVRDEDATVEAAVFCRALAARTLRINNMGRSLFDPQKYVEREIKPYSSRITLRVDGQELWSEGWRADPHLVIDREEGETLDDALRRLTNPNIQRLTEIEFPSRLSRRGEATPAGAYGKTRLGPDG